MIKKKKKLLIIGGTGFIGYHLIKFLKKKFEITSISSKRPKEIRKLKNIKYKIIDITKKKQVKKIKKDFDYVVNLGGYVDHSNKKLTFKSHYFGCINLVEHFNDTNIKSFVQIGSCLEYGKLLSPQHEASKELNTFSSYSKAKLLATKYLIKKYKSQGFPAIILRGYQIYGPRQDYNRLISVVIFNCIKNRPFPCSAGLQFRDFLYVDDFVRAISKSLTEKNAIGKIINIGYGKPLKVKNIILLIKKILRKGKPKFSQIELRKDEVQILYPSIKQAYKVLKWKPRIKFLNGLKRTISDYKKIV